MKNAKCPTEGLRIQIPEGIERSVDNREMGGLEYLADGRPHREPCSCGIRRTNYGEVLYRLIYNDRNNTDVRVLSKLW